MAKRKRTAEDIPSTTTPAQNESPKDRDSPSSTTTTTTTAGNKNAFTIPDEPNPPIQCQRHGTPSAKPALIFTHGAGGDLSAPAIQAFAAGFAQTSPLVLFKGSMNLKARTSAFETVLAHEAAARPTPALGGRSMGARAACLAASALSAGDEASSPPPPQALILVSFPLTGASQADSRAQTLLDLRAETDVLLVAGTQDTMCAVPALLGVMERMAARAWLVEVEGADHGMAVRGGLGGEEATEALRRRTGEVASAWLCEREGLEGRRVMRVRWEEEVGVVSEGWEEMEEEEEDGGG